MTPPAPPTFERIPLWTYIGLAVLHLLGGLLFRRPRHFAEAEMADGADLREWGLIGSVVDD